MNLLGCFVSIRLKLSYEIFGSCSNSVVIRIENGEVGASRTAYTLYLAGVLFDDDAGVLSSSWPRRAVRS